MFILVAKRKLRYNSSLKSTDIYLLNFTQYEALESLNSTDMWAGAVQYSLLSLDIVQNRLYSLSLYSLFPTVAMLQVYRYSIDIYMANVKMSFISQFQTITAIGTNFKVFCTWQNSPVSGLYISSKFDYHSVLHNCVLVPYKAKLIKPLHCKSYRRGNWSSNYGLVCCVHFGESTNPPLHRSQLKIIKKSLKSDECLCPEDILTPNLLLA